MIPLFSLSETALHFPAPQHALTEPNGLLAFGGDLSPARLAMAYRHGIFPWFSPGDPILWWSPDPRAVLFPTHLHLSRSMRKFLRKQTFRVTLNQAFGAVVHACAGARAEGTWISPEMEAAYGQLHQRGQAHSVEVWQGDRLVGGLYGVAQGALFCGESMFSTADNASKCALSAFVPHFTRHGGRLIDCQVLNAHTASLGAQNISRSRYLHYLAQLRDQPLHAGCWHAQTLPGAGVSA